MKYFSILLTGLIFLFSCNKDSTDTGSGNLSGEPVIKIHTIASNYEVIWGMDFLPNQDIVFTERIGNLFRIDHNDFSIHKINNVPAVYSAGQGGLLDIRVHPKYVSNGWIYMCFSSDGGYYNLVRFKLLNDVISNLESLFKSKTVDSWGGHYGSRIEFDNNGYLYFCMGEGGVGTYGGLNTVNYNAPTPSSEWGKVHRVKDDGSIPSDNPVLWGNNGLPTSVYSYGHRNPEGLVFDSASNQLFESENGPQGGDEINIIKKGSNYGWPFYSYGINYDGTEISANPRNDSIADPIKVWVPSMAPSGITIIKSANFKSWKGNLLVSSLAFHYLSRCTIENNKVVQEFKLLENIGRVRNVKQGPDGKIYISVEGPGRILVMEAE